MQIIAAIFKIKRQPNRNSAMRLLKKGMAHLEGIDPVKVEVDIERLVADAGKLLMTVETAGPDDFMNVSEEVFPKMHFLNIRTV